MKKYFILVGLLFILAVSVKGAVLSKTITGNNNGTNIITGPFHLISAVITDSSGTNNPIALYDAPNNSVAVHVFGAYTTTLTYATNIVVGTTNINGVVQSNTNAAVYTVSSSIAAVTNSYPVIASVLVPASSSVTYTPVSGIYGSYGLSLTNLGTFSITITYSTIP